jgi:hypothetical protein
MQINAGQARIKRFGFGVFMTRIDPCKDDKFLLFNNYLDNPKYQSRLECAFAISFDCIYAKKITDHFYPQRDLWRCNFNVDLKDKKFYLIIR